MSKILHLNAGNETGGGMYHLLNICKCENKDRFILGVFERGKLLEEAVKLGVSTKCFESKMRLSLPLLYKVKNYIQLHKIKFIHTHGPRANVYANLLKKICDFTWIVTVHSDPKRDFYYEGIKGSLFTYMHIKSLQNADQLIAISEEFKEKLFNLGIGQKRIITAFNGIDFKDTNYQALTKKDFGIKNNELLFLMVARLEPVKNHLLALRALREIINKQKKCHLMLLGDGSLMSYLRNKVKELSLEGHVHFLGYQRNVNCYYRLADVTLLTSDSESFPLVLLESSRMSTPVISSNVGGVKELIADNSLGWMFSAGDLQDLVKAMEGAIALYNADRLSEIGKNLKEYASKRYSLKAFEHAMFNVYKKVGYNFM